MNAKHTPGPWNVRQYFEQGSFEGFTVYSTPAIGVADIPGTDVEAIANAQLIAAAPDLLAALQKLSNLISDDESLYEAYREEMEQATAAIAKAQGRTE